MSSGILYPHGTKVFCPKCATQVGVAIADVYAFTAMKAENFKSVDGKTHFINTFPVVSGCCKYTLITFTGRLLLYSRTS